VTTRFAPQLARVLRVVPFAGDESITPVEIAARLDMDANAVSKLLERGLRKGLLVRLRTGDWQLAPGVSR
jgi:DNA-binding MarR family transcriptional regulator